MEVAKTYKELFSVNNLIAKLNPNMTKSLICGWCKSILYDPVMWTSCNINYCKIWYDVFNNELYTCPKLCNQANFSDVEETVNNTLSQLKFKCSNFEIGWN